jgi:hypothetical protein
MLSGFQMEAANFLPWEKFRERNTNPFQPARKEKIYGR